MNPKIETLKYNYKKNNQVLHIEVYDSFRSIDFMCDDIFLCNAMSLKEPLIFVYRQRRYTYNITFPPRIRVMYNILYHYLENVLEVKHLFKKVKISYIRKQSLSNGV